MHPALCIMVVHSGLPREQLRSNVQHLGRNVVMRDGTGLQQMEPFVDRFSPANHGEVFAQGQDTLLG